MALDPVEPTGDILSSPRAIRYFLDTQPPLGDSRLHTSNPVRPRFAFAWDGRPNQHERLSKRIAMTISRTPPDDVAPPAFVRPTANPRKPLLIVLLIVGVVGGLLLLGGLGTGGYFGYRHYFPPAPLPLSKEEQERKDREQRA